MSNLVPIREEIKSIIKKTEEIINEEASSMTPTVTKGLLVKLSMVSPLAEDTAIDKFTLDELRDRNSYKKIVEVYDKLCEDVKTYSLLAQIKEQKWEEVKEQSKKEFQYIYTETLKINNIEEDEVIVPIIRDNNKMSVVCKDRVIDDIIMYVGPKGVTAYQTFQKAQSDFVTKVDKTILKSSLNVPWTDFSMPTKYLTSVDSKTAALNTIGSPERVRRFIDGKTIKNQKVLDKFLRLLELQIPCPWQRDLLISAIANAFQYHNTKKAIFQCMVSVASNFVGKSLITGLIKDCLDDGPFGERKHSYVGELDLTSSSKFTQEGVLILLEDDGEVIRSSKEQHNRTKRLQSKLNLIQKEEIKYVNKTMSPRCYFIWLINNEFYATFIDSRIFLLDYSNPTHNSSMLKEIGEVTSYFSKLTLRPDEYGPFLDDLAKYFIHHVEINPLVYSRDAYKAYGKLTKTATNIFLRPIFFIDNKGDKPFTRKFYQWFQERLDGMEVSKARREKYEGSLLFKLSYEKVHKSNEAGTKLSAAMSLSNELDLKRILAVEIEEGKEFLVEYYSYQKIKASEVHIYLYFNSKLDTTKLYEAMVENNSNSYLKVNVNLGTRDPHSYNLIEVGNPRYISPLKVKGEGKWNQEITEDEFKNYIKELKSQEVSVETADI